VLIYWAILTLGPLLVGISLTASSYVWSLSGDAVAALPRSIRGALEYAPVVISGFAYAALFVFVPNRKVAWSDALVGGFIAAIMAEVFKHAFGAFVSRGTTGSIYGAFAALPLFLIWIFLSWYVVLFGAAITATLPRLRATRFADEMLAGNQFVTSVALLKALLQAKHSKTPAVRPVELARQIRMSVDETDALLEALEKLGYVRRLAVTRPGRRDDHDWMLICDENAMTLKPLFEHFAVDPTNSLLNTDALGLRPMRTRWFQSDWLKAPLAEELGDQK
jgi:membrane protein